MVAPILATSEGPCRQCMADAGLKTTKPDKVLLVGGMTRTPAVRRLVQDIFGVAPDTR